MKIKLLICFLLLSSICLASENITSKENKATLTEETLIMPLVTINDVTVNEYDGFATLTIQLDAPDTVDTVISVTTQNFSAWSPDDYTAVTMTATIPSGQTSVEVSILITDDTVGESTEDFRVNGTVTSGNTSNTNITSTVTIQDDDIPTVSMGDITVNEDIGVAIVTISLSNPSSFETIISVTTTSDTALDPYDYVTTTVTATLIAFQNTVQISIPIIDDTISEPTETFSVQGTVTTSNTFNTDPSGTVTITDNDDSIVSIEDVTVSEDLGNINVPITIQGLSPVDTQLNITVIDNTAINPDDFTLVTTSVTIPALQNSANIVISITDDDVFEPFETFTVNAMVTSGNTINLNTDATITIIDDGSCGAFTVGEPCDDGDPLTLSDFIDANCNCIGEAVEDIDGDGISNGQETLNWTNYNDSCDPVQNVGYTGFDSNNLMWQAANCDNDDLNNALEIILGTDPYDTNYNNIEGSVLYDVNNDGCNGTDDLAFPYTRININDGTNTDAIFTDNAGNYAYYTTNGSYTITPDIENPTFFNVTPIDATANFSSINNSVFNQDFCITSNGVNIDVEVVIAPILFARPGFNATYLLTYKNKGNQTVSGAIDFMYDDTVLSFLNSTQTPNSQTAGLLSWNYTDLLPFENRSIYITLNVNTPTATPPVNIGDQLLFTAMITPLSGDVLPADNIFNYTQTVVGAYDPNDITCVEGDFVDPAQIGKYLHYIINFENTGNFYAENIVVEMEIDPAQFDADTVRLLSSSHEANVSISGNIIRIIFQNIYLASGGHGNILLKLKTEVGLIENDIVSNQARIFFDYNSPILTNNAETTFAVLSTPEFEVDRSITLYPNPTKENISITANNNIKSIELYDVQGRVLTQEKHNAKQININMTNQAPGIYFIKIKTEKGVNTEKIIKM